jgi:hemerythrin-like metal-binding protein
MALLSWTNEYSVGIPSIDKQHHKLFDMINQLHDSMKSGLGGKLVPIILNNLISYTRDHFADEEKSMRQAEYSNYASHKAEHGKLTAEVVRLVKEMEAGDMAMSVEILDFLRKWLQHHILTTDKKYIAQMLAAGIR